MKIGKFAFNKRRDLLEGCKKIGIVPENCISKKDLLDWEADRLDDGIWETGFSFEGSFQKYLTKGIRAWKGGDKYKGIFTWKGKGMESGFVRGTVQFSSIVFCERVRSRGGVLRNNSRFFATH